MAFLSAIAGESIFFLGPPGVAKSLIARRLKFAFNDCQTFEYLMNRFSTPDEIFGPVSIKKLKDEDKYVRLTDKYLPGSNIVFLDEIWKAGPSIQNALLTILNEKIYRNGDQEVKVKLRGIISASNELPAQGQGLEALWDRFLIRCYVTGIEDKANFAKMVTGCGDLYCDDVSSEYKLSDAETELCTKGITKVDVPPEVIDLIHAVRLSIQEENEKMGDNHFYVSDRRWKKIVQVLRTSAYLNGRSKVDLMDCFLISHCIWEKPEDIDIVKQVVAESIRRNSYVIHLSLASLEREIETFKQDVLKEIQEKKKVNRTVLQSFDTMYYGLDNITVANGRFIPRDSSGEASQFIKIGDFNSLSNKEEQIDIFEKASKNYTQRYRVKASLGTEPFSINLRIENGYSGNQINLCSIKTATVEDEEIIQKEPHAVLIGHWNQQAGVLKHQVDEQKQALEKYLKTDLGMIRKNLFVDPRNADIVEDKVNNLKKALEGLNLSIEGTVHLYVSKKDGTV